MTTDNTPVSSPDFSVIKQNFINYLQNQSQFSDYNYDGSAINFLLDILAYNTVYNAVHTNLGFAETFLDSAVLRGSVVSRAKELGYVPRSCTSATATIQISFVVSGNPSEYVLPQGTKFSSTNGSDTYTFTTTEDIIISNNGSNVFSATITLNQGQFSTTTYTVNLNNPLQRLIVPNTNIDTNFLTVSYMNSSSDTVWNPVTYYKDLNIAELTATTDVYFLKETYDGYFEVYFGDDVIGRSAKTGNIIQFNYLICNASDPNGANNFSLASTLTDVSSISIVTVTPATGGDEIETVESIKYLAPFYYQAQDRAVTADDYKIIKNIYPNIADLVIWGGETNNPPYYGKVFIAIKPTDTTTVLSNATKLSIQNDIVAKLNIVSVRPEIVDPDYIFVAVNIVSTYNAKLYNSSNDAPLQTSIPAAVTAFFNSQTNMFGQPLYYSKLVAAIDGADPYITNSIVNLTLMKQTPILSGIAGQYTFNYNNAIHPNSVASNAFVINNVTWYIEDVPTGTSPYTTGTLSVYRIDGSNTIYLNQNAGTVNYNTGEITISNLSIDSILNDPIENNLQITVAPGQLVNTASPQTVYVDNNVYTDGQAQIITLMDNGITLTLIPDNTV